MKCTIELAPSGDLCLTTPTGRELLLSAEPAAIALLRRILYHAGEHEHQPVAYPTQHVLDAWRRGREIDWTQREPVVKRTVVEVLPQPVRKKPKRTLKAFAHERGSGVDLSKVTFQL